MSLFGNEGLFGVLGQGIGQGLNFTSATENAWGQAQQSLSPSLAELQKYQDLIMRQMAQATAPAPVKPKNLPEEEMVCATGGLIGWRAWNCGPFDQHIASFNGELWKPCERLVATDKGGKENMGIYAWKVKANVTEGQPHARVWGEVWLWGRVLDCEHGYRAEFAYPKAFVNTGIQARKMATTYRVPLID